VINADLIFKLHGYSTARTSGILTWMQVAVKEEPSMILSMTKSYYNEKTKFIIKCKELGKSIYCYSMHDSKMLYSLTQHSLWSCKYYLFSI